MTQFINNSVVERSDDWAYQTVDQIIQQSLSVIQDPDEVAAGQRVSGVSVDTAQVSSESTASDNSTEDTRVWRSFILDTIYRTVTELGHSYGVDTASVNHIQRVLSETRALDQVQVSSEWSESSADRVEAVIVRATQRALLDHRLAELGIVPYTAPPSASAILYPSEWVPIPVSSVSVSMASVDTAMLQVAREAAQSLSGVLALADWIAIAQSISSGLSVMDAPDYCQSIAVMLGVNAAGESVQGLVFPDANGIQKLITQSHLVHLDTPVASIQSSGIQPAILRYSDTAMVVDGPIPGMGSSLVDGTPVIASAIAVDTGRLGQVIATEQTQGRNPMDFIDPDAAVVVNLVNDWQSSGYVQSGMTETEIITAVHRYVADRIAYQSDVGDQWQTVAQTLARGAGDCEDMAILVASLAARALHAVGMEDLAETVRLEAGLMADGSVGHMVARVGEQWVVDATQAVAIQDRAAVALDSVYVLGMNGVQQTGRLDQVARLKRVGTAQVQRKTARQYLQWYIENSGLFFSETSAPTQVNPAIDHTYIDEYNRDVLGDGGSNWNHQHDSGNAGTHSDKWDKNQIYNKLDSISQNLQYTTGDVQAMDSALRYDGRSDTSYVSWTIATDVGKHNNGTFNDGGHGLPLSVRYLEKLRPSYNGQANIAIHGVKEVHHQINPSGTDADIIRTNTIILKDVELEYIREILLQQPSQVEITRRTNIISSLDQFDLIDPIFNDDMNHWTGTTFDGEGSYPMNSALLLFNDINQAISASEAQDYYLPESKENAINYIFGDANFSGSTINLDQTKIDAINSAVTKVGFNSEFEAILKFSLSHSGTLNEDNIPLAVDRAKQIYNTLYNTTLNEDKIGSLKNYLVGAWVHGVEYTDNPYEILYPLNSAVSNRFKYAKFSNSYLSNNNLDRIDPYIAIKHALGYNYYNNNHTAQLDFLSKAVQRASSSNYVDILNQYFPNIGLQSGDANKLNNINQLRSKVGQVIPSIPDLESARALWKLIHGVYEYNNNYSNYSDPIKFFFEKLDNDFSNKELAETETRIAQSLHGHAGNFDLSVYFDDENININKLMSSDINRRLEEIRRIFSLRRSNSIDFNLSIKILTYILLKTDGNTANFLSSFSSDYKQAAFYVVDAVLNHDSNNDITTILDFVKASLNNVDFDNDFNTMMSDYKDAKANQFTVDSSSYSSDTYSLDDFIGYLQLKLVSSISNHGTITGVIDDAAIDNLDFRYTEQTVEFHEEDNVNYSAFFDSENGSSNYKLNLAGFTLGEYVISKDEGEAISFFTKSDYYNMYLDTGVTQETLEGYLDIVVGLGLLKKIEVNSEDYYFYTGSGENISNIGDVTGISATLSHSFKTKYEKIITPLVDDTAAAAMKETLKKLSLTPEKVIDRLKPTVENLQTLKQHLDRQLESLKNTLVITIENSGDQENEKFSAPKAVKDLSNNNAGAIVTARSAAYNAAESATNANSNVFDAYYTAVGNYQGAISSLEISIDTHKQTIYDNIKSLMDQMMGVGNDSVFNISSVLDANGFNDDAFKHEFRRYINHVIDRVNASDMGLDLSVDMSALREDMRFFGVGQISAQGLMNASRPYTTLIAQSPVVETYLSANSIDDGEFRQIIASLQLMGVVTGENTVFDDFSYEPTYPMDLPNDFDLASFDIAAKDLVYTNSSGQSYAIDSIHYESDGQYRLEFGDYNGQHISFNSTNKQFKLHSTSDEEPVQLNKDQFKQHQKTISANGLSWSLYSIQNAIRLEYESINDSDIKKVIQLINANKPVLESEFESIQSAIASTDYFEIASSNPNEPNNDIVLSQLNDSYSIVLVSQELQSKFSEDRSNFIAQLVKNAWQSFNNGAGESTKEIINTIQSKRTEFNNQDYIQQISVAEKYDNFLFSYFNLYYSGHDTPSESLDSGQYGLLMMLMARYQIKGSTLVEPLFFNNAAHTIPDKVVVSDVNLQTIPVSSMADTIMNAVRIQQLQRELVTGAFSMSIQLQNLMNQQTKVMAQSLIVEAYLHTHSSSSTEDLIDTSQLREAATNNPTQANNLKYTKGSYWNSIANGEIETPNWVGTWSEFQENLKSNNVSWPILLPGDHVVSTDSEVIDAIDVQGIETSHSRSLVEFSNDISLDNLYQYLNDLVAQQIEIERAIIAAPSVVEQRLAQSGGGVSYLLMVSSIRAKHFMATSAIQQPQKIFSMSNVKHYVQVAVNLKHVLDFLYYLMSEHANRMYLVLSVLYGEEGSSTARSAEFDSSQFLGMLSDTFSNRISSISLTLNQQQAALQRALAEDSSRLDQNIINNPSKKFYKENSNKMNRAMWEMSQVLVELNLMETANQAINQAKSLSAVAQSFMNVDGVSIVEDSHQRIHDQYNSLVTYERSEEMEDYMINMNELINLFGAPPSFQQRHINSLRVNRDALENLINHVQSSNFDEAGDYYFDSAWLDSENWGELAAQIIDTVQSDQDLENFYNIRNDRFLGYDLSAGFGDVRGNENMNTGSTNSVTRYMLPSDFLDEDGDGYDPEWDLSVVGVVTQNTILGGFTRVEAIDLAISFNVPINPGHDDFRIDIANQLYRVNRAVIQSIKQSTSGTLELEMDPHFESIITQIDNVDNDSMSQAHKDYYKGLLSELQTEYVAKLTDPPHNNKLNHITTGPPESAADTLNSIVSDNHYFDNSGELAATQIQVYRRPIFDVDESKMLSIRSRIIQLSEISQLLSALFQKTNTQYRRIMKALYGHSAVDTQNNLMQMLSDNHELFNEVMSSSESAIGDLKNYVNQTIDYHNKHLQSILDEEWMRQDLISAGFTAAFGLGTTALAAASGLAAPAVSAASGAFESSVEIAMAAEKKSAKRTLLGSIAIPHSDRLNAIDLAQLVQSGDADIDRAIYNEIFGAMNPDTALVGTPGGEKALNAVAIDKIRRKIKKAQKARMLRINLNMRSNDIMERLLQALYNIKPNDYLGKIKDILGLRNGFSMVVFEGVQRDIRDEMDRQNKEYEKNKQIAEIDAEFDITVAFALGGFALSMLPGLSGLDDTSKIRKILNKVLSTAGKAGTAALKAATDSASRLAKSVSGRVRFKVVNSLGFRGSRSTRVSQFIATQLTAAKEFFEKQLQRAIQFKTDVNKLVQQSVESVKEFIRRIARYLSTTKSFQEVKRFVVLVQNSVVNPIANSVKYVFNRIKFQYRSFIDSKSFREFVLRYNRFIDSEAFEKFRVSLVYDAMRRLVVLGGKQATIPIVQGSEKFEYSAVNQSIDLEQTGGLNDQIDALTQQATELKNTIEGDPSLAARSILISVLMDMYTELFHLQLKDIMEASMASIKQTSDHIVKASDGMFANYYSFDQSLVTQMMQSVSDRQSLLFIGQMASSVNVRIQDAVMQSLYGVRPTSKTNLLSEYNQLSVATIKSSMSQVREYMDAKIRLINNIENTQRLASEATIRMAVTGLLAVGTFVMPAASVFLFATYAAYPVIDVALRAQRKFSANRLEMQSISSGLGSDFTLTTSNSALAAVMSRPSPMPAVTAQPVVAQTPTQESLIQSIKDLSNKIPASSLSNTRSKLTGLSQALSQQPVSSNSIETASKNLIQSLSTEGASQVSAARSGQLTVDQSLQLAQLAINVANLSTDVQSLVTTMQSTGSVSSQSVNQVVQAVQSLVTTMQSTGSVSSQLVNQVAQVVQSLVTTMQSTGSVSSQSVNQVVQVVQSLVTVMQQSDPVSAVVSKSLAQSANQLVERANNLADSSQYAAEVKLSVLNTVIAVTQFAQTVQSDSGVDETAKPDSFSVQFNAASFQQLQQKAKQLKPQTARQIETQLFQDMINNEQLTVAVDNQLLFNNEAQVLLERKLELLAIQQRLMMSAMDKKNQIIQAVLAQLFSAAFEQNSVAQFIVSNIQTVNQMVVESMMKMTNDWLIRENSIRNMDSELNAAALSSAATSLIGWPLSVTKAPLTGKFLERSTLSDQSFLELMMKRGDKGVSENLMIFLDDGNFETSRSEFDGKKSTNVNKLDQSGVMDRDQARMRSLRSPIMGAAAMREYSQLRGESYKYRRAEAASNKALYETIATTSQGFSELIKKRYGADSFSHIKNTIRERALAFRQLVKDLNVVTVDDLELRDDKKQQTIEELKDKGVLDASNVIKIWNQQGAGQFLGASADQPKSWGVYTKIGLDDIPKLWILDKSGNHSELRLRSNTGAREALIKKLKDQRPSGYSSSLFWQSVGKGLVSAASYYLSFGVITSGYIDQQYDQYNNHKKQLKTIQYITEKLKNNKGSLTPQELAVAKALAGYQWKAVLQRLSGSYPWAHKLYNAFKPAYSDGFFVSQVQNKFMNNRINKRLDYQLFADELIADPDNPIYPIIARFGHSNKSINKGFVTIMRERGLLDNNGISLLPQKIANYAQLTVRDDRKKAILDYLNQVFEPQQLASMGVSTKTDSSQKRVQVIIDSIADVMCEMRECVITEVTV